MPRISVISVNLWIFVLAGAFHQGMALISLPHSNSPSFGSGSVAMILMPLLFLAAMPIWAKGNIFDAAAVREWVTRRYGKAAYEEYLSNIRPMLLLAIANLVLGLVGFFKAARSSAPLGAYVLSAFFVFSALGLVICRYILVKKGLLNE